jgi:formamidopyrimidine-DNA glycosylase
MPELPEVENMRRSLLPCILNKRIIKVEVLTPKIVYSNGTIRREDSEITQKFVDGFQGTIIKNIDRRAKHLIFELSDSGAALVHLKMTGQFLYYSLKPKTLSKHTHITWLFEDGSFLEYQDIRKFGYVLYRENFSNFVDEGFFKSLGFEPLESDFTSDKVESVISNKKTILKSFLLNQKNIVGIGNIYADEICFDAKLHPLRTVDTISKSEINKLTKSIKSILQQAVLSGGSTISNYRMADGKGGDYAKLHKVYGRAGKYCHDCNEQLDLVRTVQKRATVFCKKCQK